MGEKHGGLGTGLIVDFYDAPSGNNNSAVSQAVHWVQTRVQDFTPHTRTSLRRVVLGSGSHFNSDTNGTEFNDLTDSCYRLPDWISC